VEARVLTGVCIVSISGVIKSRSQEKSSDECGTSVTMPVCHGVGGGALG
jgi:hypothetical protein